MMFRGKLIASGNDIIRPEGFTIPFQASRVHGISTERALSEGKSLDDILRVWKERLSAARYLVGHNISGFDIHVLDAEFIRRGSGGVVLGDTSRFEVLDTMHLATQYISEQRGIRTKYPKLSEMYEVLTGGALSGAHDASKDTEATARCFFLLQKKGIIAWHGPQGKGISSIRYESPRELSPSVQKRKKEGETKSGDKKDGETKAEGEKKGEGRSKKGKKGDFGAHLLIRSQFSVIAGLMSVEDIIRCAKQSGHRHVGLCDIGGMHGAFVFMEAAKRENITGILGCEVFMSETPSQKKFTREQPDKRYRQPLIARNMTGYTHLCKLSSLGYLEGLYGIYPRVGREAIAAHKEGLIALSGSIYGELGSVLLNQGKEAAEKVLSWWVGTFKEDFYLQITHHGLEEEAHVNTQFLSWARRDGIKILGLCEVFYAQKADYDIHDTLLCVKESQRKSDSIRKGYSARHLVKGRDYHYRSSEEMAAEYAEISASDGWTTFLSRISSYSIHRAVQVPVFKVPSGYESESAYLSALVQAGVLAKYKGSSSLPQARARVEEELAVITKAGYSGYFLIIHEIVCQAQKMEVIVGPGRGSVGGSVVAYALGITRADPLRYGLLFERFLNPDRISLPDIDIDFDDENREKILRWVVERYGKDKVAQIITSGTMAARSSIRDCARVWSLEIEKANYLAKQVSGKPGTTLSQAFRSNAELRRHAKGDGLEAKILSQAQVIEGTVRNFGTHACGVIISPKPLISLVPLTLSKDKDWMLTQYDNKVVEKAAC